MAKSFDELAKSIMSSKARARAARRTKELLAELLLSEVRKLAGKSQAELVLKDFFNTNGYLAGVKMLDEKQIERLGQELSEIVDPHHPGNELFYEFHSNESADA